MVILHALFLFLACGTRRLLPTLAAVDVAPPAVIWYAPFYSGGGYCSEATAFVLGLQKLGVPVRIVHFGDSYNHDYLTGLDSQTRNALASMERARISPKDAVVICHAEPGAWHPSSWARLPCPPVSSLYTIGRTMFETDRIPAGWVERLNRMDEVWVPSSFNKRTFQEGGTASNKVKVIGEPVNINFFNRDRVSVPFDLPGLEHQDGSENSAAHHRSTATIFLSIFKWEARKGWDVLLESYFREFTKGKDDVALYILTTSFHSTGDFEDQVEEFAKEQLNLDLSDLPPVRIIRWLPQEDIPRLYAAATALVQPSRGEGWGRPHAEAMSMGLPVVATNWSGSTEFLTENNSYLIEIEEDLVLVGKGAFRDHKWAQPSPTSLREIMRHIHENPDLAVSRGKRGQELMRSRYSPERMAVEVKGHLQRIAMALNGQGEL